MRSQPPIHLLLGQLGVVEVEKRTRGDIRKLDAQGREYVDDARIKRQAVEGDEMLRLLAAVDESLQVAAEELKHPALDHGLGDLVVLDDSERGELQCEHTLSLPTDDVNLG